MEELDEIKDISSESALIGCLINNLHLFEEYIDLIASDYDFTDSGLRFIYNLLAKVYLVHDKINETSVNIEVSKMSKKEQDIYQSLSGFSIFKRLSKLAKTHKDVSVLYDKVKLYNVLRSLDEKGFAIRKNLDKLKDKTIDEVLKAFELQLHKATSFVKGVDEGIDIGKGMLDFYEKLKITPDIGEPIFNEIINEEIGGLRLGTVLGIGAFTNTGKSRYIVRLLCELSVIGRTPSLLIINETQVDEFKAQMLTCIVNQVILKDDKRQINEKKIRKSTCTPEEDELVKQAALYIEENSLIKVYHTNIYDPNTLKMVIRKNQLRHGTKHFFIDIYKPFRSGRSAGMNEWQQFADGISQIKEMATGLNIFVGFTFQLKTKDDRMPSNNLSISDISNGTHIAHYVDTLVMMREISYKEKTKLGYMPVDSDNPFADGSTVYQLEAKATYHHVKIVKNRYGNNNVDIIQYVQRGEYDFNEIGIMGYLKKD